MADMQSIYGVRGSVTVTLSGATAVEPTRGIYVGVAGNIKVTYVDGYEDTLTNLCAGMWHPMQVKTIHQTGTTATDIHAGY